MPSIIIVLCMFFALTLLSSMVHCESLNFTKCEKSMAQLSVKSVNIAPFHDHPGDSMVLNISGGPIGNQVISDGSFVNITVYYLNSASSPIPVWKNAKPEICGGGGNEECPLYPGDDWKVVIDSTGVPRIPGMPVIPSEGHHFNVHMEFVSQDKEEIDCINVYV